MRSKKQNNIIVRLLGLMNGMKLEMTLAIIVGILGNLCAIFIPTTGVLLMLSYTTMINVAPQTLIVLLIVFVICRAIFRYCEQGANHYIAFKLLAHIRDVIFTKLRELAPSKLAGNDKGDLIALITSDIELLEVFYAHTISPVAIALSVSLIVSVIVANISLVLSFILILGYLIVGIIIPIYISNAGREVGEQFREKNSNISSYMLENIRGLDEINQYDCGQQRIKQMEKDIHAASNAQMKLKQFEGHTTGLTNLTIIITSLLVLIVGRYLSINNQLDVSSLVLVFVLSISSYGPVIAISNVANNLLLTFAAARRLFAILDEVPNTKDITNGHQVDAGNIQVSNLKFGYDQTKIIIEDLNECIKENEIIGVKGASGSGKSTFVHLLMRYFTPDSGEICISNMNLEEISSNSLRDSQSLVSQTTVLFNKSIIDNIRVGNLQATDDEVERAIKAAGLETFINNLPNGLDTNVGELGSSISGGEKQRIGLARAFIHQSNFLFLDEPTANLDALNEAMILKAISQLKGTKTIVIVSHRASTLSICDRIISFEGIK